MITNATLQETVSVGSSDVLCFPSWSC